MTFKHGFAREGNVEPLHSVWRSMLQRCYSTNDRIYTYPYYAGRGIKVYLGWQKDYLNFRNWAYANGYSKNLTIERINNDGPYSPSNCKFATQKEQNRNRRDNRLITYNGKTQSLAAWAEEIGLPYGTFATRIDKLKWPIEKALTVPNLSRNHCVHGHEYTTQNSYVRPNGYRECKVCIKARGKKCYSARKQSFSL